MNNLKTFLIMLVVAVLIFAASITCLNALNYASSIGSGFIGVCAVVSIATLVCGTVFLVRKYVLKDFINN